jgi:hypothetical protein
MDFSFDKIEFEMMASSSLFGSEQKEETDHPNQDASEEYDKPDCHSCKHVRPHFQSSRLDRNLFVRTGLYLPSIPAGKAFLSCFFVPVANLRSIGTLVPVDDAARV